MAGGEFQAVPTDESFHDVTREVGGIPLHFPHPRRWWIAFGFSLSLFLLFLASAAWVFWWDVGVWGNNIPVNWGFPIANYVWWIGLGHAGTLISALLLLLGQEWRNSLNRFAEAMTLGALICGGLYPILHLGRPWFFYWMLPYPSSMGVWPQFRSPLVWDIWAVLTYLSVSIIFWYIGLIPDLAAVRDRAKTRGWQVFFGVLALGWRGSASHWMRWNKTYRICAAIAVPLVVSVHSEISLLFAVGQLPGWHSTVFPPYFVMGAAFSGFAIVAIISIVIRSAFGLRDLVSDTHIELLAKVLLATGWMTMYGYFVEIFDALYSGEADEIRKLVEHLTGAYAWAYWGAIVFNFGFLQLLWSRRVRRSAPLVFVISLGVMIGMWLERYMIVVATLYRDFLVSSYGLFVPTFWDWSLFAGMIGLFLTFYLLFIRIFPSISMFEEKEVLEKEKEAERA